MSSTLFDLTGKVALVTGAAQGMGRAMAMALSLAEAGADLLLVDRNENGVRNTAAEITRLGRAAEVAARDVSDPGEVRAAVTTR